MSNETWLTQPDGEAVVRVNKKITVATLAAEFGNDFYQETASVYVLKDGVVALALTLSEAADLVESLNHAGNKVYQDEKRAAEEKTEEKNFQELLKRATGR